MKIDGASIEDLPALGFIGLGPKYYSRNSLAVMADEWEDRVDTVCRTMLGLTVACARCHDHKFDPVSMRDYYALAGVFASTSMVNKTADGQPMKEPAKGASLDPAVLHLVEDAKPQDLNVFVRQERIDARLSEHALYQSCGYFVLGLVAKECVDIPPLSGSRDWSPIQFLDTFPPFG